MSAELNIRKFDMTKMKNDSVVVILAKRRSGKSYLCRDIMYNRRHTPCGMVISPTEKASPFYKDFVPGLYIHDKYSSELISKFMRRQTEEVEKSKKDITRDPSAFLIFDDLMFSAKEWTKDPCVKEIFLNGRHMKISFILLMQFPMGISPALRSNCDYTFLLQENNTNNRRRLYEHYAGVFPSFQSFCSALDSCTVNYGCMVIDNTSTSGNLEDSVFWYRAEKKEDFRVGNDKFWKYHEKYYDPDYRSKTQSVSKNSKVKLTFKMTD
tara:strand:- start:244 stop:1044 length:801 start_codon:yes stop_codon:yes gene_type:complete